MSKAPASTSVMSTSHSPRTGGHHTTGQVLATARVVGSIHWLTLVCRAPAAVALVRFIRRNRKALHHVFADCPDGCQLPQGLGSGLNLTKDCILRWHILERRQLHLAAVSLSVGMSKLLRDAHAECCAAPPCFGAPSCRWSTCSAFCCQVACKLLARSNQCAATASRQSACGSCALQSRQSCVHGPICAALSSRRAVMMHLQRGCTASVSGVAGHGFCKVWMRACRTTIPLAQTDLVAALEGRATTILGLQFAIQEHRLFPERLVVAATESGGSQLGIEGDTRTLTSLSNSYRKTTWYH